MSTTITPEAAQSIADELNGYIGSGQAGVCVFRPDGSGGQFYPPDSYGFGPDVLVFTVPQLPRDRYTAASVIAASLPEETLPPQREAYTIEWDGTIGALQVVLQEETGRVLTGVAPGGRLGVEASVMLSDAELAAVERRLRATGRAWISD